MCLAAHLREQSLDALDALMVNHQREASSKLADSDVKRRMLNERIEVRDGGIGISFLRDQFGRPLTVLFGARRTAGFYLPGGYCPDQERFLPWPDEGLEVRRLLLTAES